MSDQKPRGSDAVLKRFNERHAFPADSAKLIASLADHADITFTEGFPLGTPHPYGFSGSLHVTPNGVSEVLAALIKARVKFEVFPRGIIAPDLFNIHFTTEH